MTARKTLVIGVDIDNTLQGYDSWYEQYYLSLGIGASNPAGLTVTERFATPTVDMKRLSNTVYPRYLEEGPALPGAFKCLKQLKELSALDVQIGVITNRIQEEEEDLTKRWFQSQGFTPDFYEFRDMHGDGIQDSVAGGSTNSKYTACVRHGVQVIVEDNPDTALDLAEKGISVILISYPYNKHVVHKNIKRVEDWAEVDRAIRIGILADVELMAAVLSK